MTVLVTILAVAVGLLAILVAGLLRTHAEILRSLHDLGVGLEPDTSAATRRPPLRTQPGVTRPREASGGAGFDVTGTSLAGEAVHIAVAGTDHLTLVAFLSSTCLTCQRFWTAFAEPGLAIPGGARLVVVTKELGSESESALRRLAPPAVTTVLSDRAWDAYAVPGAPYFVLVDGTTGDVVGEGSSSSWEQVRALLSQAMADTGLAAERGQRVNDGPVAARARRDGAAREARVDEDLRAAGIGPGDPSLRPERET
ncbi:MAG: hypothetical protein QOK06_811 [Acidimicrobiaceae bacterium]